LFDQIAFDVGQSAGLGWWDGECGFGMVPAPEVAGRGSVARATERRAVKSKTFRCIARSMAAPPPRPLIPVDELRAVDRQHAPGGVPSGAIVAVGLGVGRAQDSLQRNAPKAVDPVAALLEVQ